jgi:hypothetical protein
MPENSTMFYVILKNDPHRNQYMATLFMSDVYEVLINNRWERYPEAELEFLNHSFRTHSEKEMLKNAHSHK